MGMSLYHSREGRGGGGGGGGGVVVICVTDILLYAERNLTIVLHYNQSRDYFPADVCGRHSPSLGYQLHSV